LLTLIPTPIGNLEDISFRVLNGIERADVILCEDTRVTKKLLSLLASKYNKQFNYKKIIPIHSHNEKEFLDSIDRTFFDDEIIYLSDAGMPAISDPGALLVDYAINNSIDYDVIPGANALLVAYAMSGFNSKEFTFYGFLPHKSSNRLEILKTILKKDEITILYESPHRILQFMKEIVSLDENREIFLAKELTKLHQTTFRAFAKELLDILSRSNIKGEWVVVINRDSSQKERRELILDESSILDLDIPPKIKSKLLSKVSDKKASSWYNELVK
jgi:16S rRNA (cytidine1402-2'-O)-methyltransferase